MEELQVEHIIHAPRKGLNDKLYPIRPNSPRKDGYLTRAWSAGIIDAEFDDAMFHHFTPFFATMFKQDQRIDFVTLTKIREKIFLARCFWRPSLDEVGRPGLASHIIAIPVEALSRGLSFSVVYEAARDYDTNNGVPSGEIPQLKLSWSNEENQTDPDTVGSTILAREYVSKIFSYVSKPDLHVLTIVRGASSEDRRKAAFFLGKLLYRADAVSYAIASAIPVDVVLDKYTILVGERDNDFGGQSENWRKVRVGGSMPQSNPEMGELKEKSESLLDQVYGHS
jgi:hypothetical protein